MAYMPAPTLSFVLMFLPFLWDDAMGGRITVKLRHQIAAENANIVCKAALKRALHFERNYSKNTIYPVTPEILQSIIRSLEDGCDQFDVGEASRSDTSEFEMTRDKRWVVKVVSKYEVDSLERIIDKQYMYKHRIAFPHTGLVPIFFPVPEVSAVVMPNFVKEAEDAMHSILRSSRVHFFKYDVKPHQVTHSAERTPFLVKLADLEWDPENDDTLMCKACSGNSYCHSQDCWRTLQSGLENDFIFLNKGRTYEFVDYSLVFMLGVPNAFGAAKKDEALPYESLPGSCIHSRRKGLMLCVRVVDYLIEKTFFRWVESMFKNWKFSAYDKAMTELLNCVGDLKQEVCRPYLEMACENSVSSWCALVGKFTLPYLWRANKLPVHLRPLVLGDKWENGTNISFPYGWMMNHIDAVPPN